MAENSLQNPKNEDSFVLSDNAKAIIEKFEKQIEDCSENDKNGFRIDLLMLLLRRLHPEVHSADSKGIFAELYRLNSSTTDKNAGFLMHCFSENELNDLSNEFNSIWNYYCSMFSIEGIPSSNDCKELLLCESIMPDGKRRLVVNYAFLTLSKKELDLLKRKSKSLLLKKDQIQDEEILTLQAELLCDSLMPSGKRNPVVNDSFLTLSKNELDFLKSFLLKEDRIQDKELMAELEMLLNTLSLGLLVDRIVIPRIQFISNSSFNSFVEFFENNVSDDGTVFVMDSPTELNTNDHLQFRKWAVDNKFLHGVIEMKDLPSYDAERQILVLKKQPTDSIFFAWVDGPMDGSGPSVKEIKKIIAEKDPDYYKMVSMDDFKAHNRQYYTFIQRQFVPMVTANEGETIVRLGDLVDLYESKTEEDVNCFFLNRRFYFDEGSNYLEGVVMPYARRVPNNEFFLFRWDEDSESFLCSRLNPEKLDFDSSYSTGVRNEFDSEGNPIICTYPDAIIFKIKENPFVPIDPNYLERVLVLDASDEVFSQMEHYKLPYSDVFMDEDDFLSIKVAIPSMEQQLKIMNPIHQQILADTKEEFQKKYEKYKQDIRMKKHALAQRLRIMKNWWQNLQMAREDGHGVVDDEATIGKLHPVSVKEIYSQIDREMNMLFKQVNAFNLGDTMASEVFDAKEFVQQYVKQHDPMFEYQCELPQGTANIRFPKDALQIILDNIASNACSHGFKGRENESNIIRLVMEIKRDDLIVRIGNNGNPMSPSMTSEKVFTYGETTEEGVGEHGGLGGFQIKDLMSKFGNVVELELDENAEFPVVYKLVFRDVNIYK